MNRAATLLVMMFLTAAPALAGVILNTVSGSGSPTPGWTGGLSGSFDASGGNSERMTLSGGGRIVWSDDNDVWRLQGQMERAESQSQEIARSVVGHLRQNHQLTGSLFSVTFVQLQHNPFQRLQSRWLFGAGGRWDIFDDEFGKFSVGVTHMLELERIDGVSGQETDHRLSAFVVVSRKVSDNSKLTGVSFVQPKWSEFSDRRAMGRLSLDVSLTGSLSLNVGGSLEYDSNPPEGVDTTDWKTTTGLSVKF